MFFSVVVLPYSSPTHSEKYLMTDQTYNFTKRLHISVHESAENSRFNTFQPSPFFGPLYHCICLPYLSVSHSTKGRKRWKKFEGSEISGFLHFQGQTSSKKERQELLKKCLSYLCFCFLLRSSCATEAQVSASFTASLSLRKRSFSGYFLSSASSNITLSSITSAITVHNLYVKTKKYFRLLQRPSIKVAKASSILNAEWRVALHSD